MRRYPANNRNKFDDRFHRYSVHQTNNSVNLAVVKENLSLNKETEIMDFGWAAMRIVWTVDQSTPRK